MRNDADREKLLRRAMPIDFWSGEVAFLLQLLDETRLELIAFCVPFAAVYALGRGWPDGHFAAKHYDILARAGAQMDSFVRRTD